VIRRLLALFRSGVSIEEIDAFRRPGIDAYDLAESLPVGWARYAAWNAFVLQTYGDKLIEAGESDGYVPGEIAIVARGLFRLVGEWLLRARQLEATPALTMDVEFPGELPNWRTSIRESDELAGMRATLEALRAWAASDLDRFGGEETAEARLRGRLAAVDSAIDTVDALWTSRPPEELRGGIGDALVDGLERANQLGQLLAQPALLERVAHD